MTRWRWDCEKSGCFAVRGKARLEQWDDCFPGKIGMSDVDGVVEINGRVLFCEWKPGFDDLPTGQRILLERLTGLGFGHRGMRDRGQPRDRRDARLADNHPGALAPVGARHARGSREEVSRVGRVGRDGSGRLTMALLKRPPACPANPRGHTWDDCDEPAPLETPYAAWTQRCRHCDTRRYLLSNFDVAGYSAARLSGRR